MVSLHVQDLQIAASEVLALPEISSITKQPHTEQVENNYIISHTAANNSAFLF